MAFSGTGIAIDQSRESAFLGCISADASRQAALEGVQTPRMTPGQVLREQRLRDQGLECRLGEVSPALSSNPEYRLVAAGDQACAWLADRPWGEPPPVPGRGVSTVDALATYHREDLEASGGTLTAEEELSAEVALPAWDKLCPFQQDVHKGHGFRNGELNGLAVITVRHRKALSAPHYSTDSGARLADFRADPPPAIASTTLGLAINLNERVGEFGPS
jgi:hypothetical protein